MAAIQLGAPGIYPVPPAATVTDTGLVRLDIAGFVGIAPRGPVNHPVAVESWDEYVHRFGGYGASEPGECPGMLAYGVAAFFRQGGSRAWVVRVAPPDQVSTPPAPAQATATFTFDRELVETAVGPVSFSANGEGAWGNGLRIQLAVEPGGEFRPAAETPAVEAFGTSGKRRLVPPDGAALVVGSLLRLRSPALAPHGTLRWVTDVAEAEVDGRRRPVAELDAPIPPGSVAVAVLTGTLSVSDSDAGRARVERFDRLGLSPLHPRWAAAVVAAESTLLMPTGAWAAPSAAADPLAHAVVPALPLPAGFEAAGDGGGRDRYAEIDGDSFFDPGEPGPEEPGSGGPAESPRRRGIDALVPAVGEIGLLAVPDLLYAPRPEVTERVLPTPTRRPRFGPCEPLQSLTYTRRFSRPPLLDPDSDYEAIVERQRRLLARTAPDRPFVVLLDVPLGLPAERVRTWRTAFDSAFAAAYHPWLRVSRPGGTATVAVPPCGFAAGIVAARERRFGVSRGPANEVALDAVGVAEAVTDEQHASLHRDGVNVFRPERDGVRLTAARTLSRDPGYRQLTVRRLMTQLRLTIARRAESAVFEPNTVLLRTELRLQLTALLSELFRAGVLAGASEAEAFFVRCDESVNPASSVDQGRLLIEVGVAPAEPIEFVLLRVALATDRGVTVEEVNR